MEKNLRITVGNKPIFTNMETIKANHALERDLAYENGKGQEFDRSKNYGTLIGYTEALISGEIKSFDNQLSLEEPTDNDSQEKEFCISYKSGGQDYEARITAESKEQALARFYEVYSHYDDLWDVVCW